MEREKIDVVTTLLVRLQIGMVMKWLKIREHLQSQEEEAGE